MYRVSFGYRRTEYGTYTINLTPALIEEFNSFYQDNQFTEEEIVNALENGNYLDSDFYFTDDGETYNLVAEASDFFSEYAQNYGDDFTNDSETYFEDYPPEVSECE